MHCRHSQPADLLAPMPWLTRPTEDGHRSSEDGTTGFPARCRRSRNRSRSGVGGAKLHLEVSRGVVMNSFRLY